MASWCRSDIPSLAGRTALVTGANRGLGREIATALAAAGATVIAGCRDLARMDATIAAIRTAQPRADLVALPVDLADLSSVRAFAAEVAARWPRLDILCHNAAAIMVPQGRTRDGFETHLGTNHVAPFALTGLLLETLQRAPAARVVNTGSLAHRMTAGLDLDDAAYERRAYREMDAYGASKLAALAFTFELDRRLRRAGSSVIAVAAHPGYSATNDDAGGFFMRLATRLFAQAPAIGALPALYAATAPEARGGDYIGPAGFKELRGAPRRVEASDAARDPALGERLWAWSERASGVRYLPR
ncbi:oxidoreductase [Solimonas soli]|uniref:oxidoreductase n=1 Tax=Solimonas soli TaxID=413479 RepID=UPI0005BA0569|nr:oxidoreductase [Solimonas soli]